MSFFLLGLLVVVAVHFSVSLVLSLLAAVALPHGERVLRRGPARRQAAGFFALALLPAVGGLLVALVVALPAWVRHEPRGAAERPGPVLLGLAAAGLVVWGLRVGGALRDHRRTSRLVTRWIGAGPGPAGPPPARHPCPLRVSAGRGVRDVASAPALVGPAPSRSRRAGDPGRDRARARPRLGAREPAPLRVARVPRSARPPARRGAPAGRSSTRRPRSRRTSARAPVFRPCCWPGPSSRPRPWCRRGKGSTWRSRSSIARAE